MEEESQGEQNQFDYEPNKERFPYKYVICKFFVNHFALAFFYLIVYGNSLV